jgi:hypothetical protein
MTIQSSENILSTTNQRLLEWVSISLKEVVHVLKLNGRISITCHTKSNATISMTVASTVRLSDHLKTNGYVYFIVNTTENTIEADFVMMVSIKCLNINIWDVNQ